MLSSRLRIAYILATIYKQKKYPHIRESQIELFVKWTNLEALSIMKAPPLLLDEWSLSITIVITSAPILSTDVSY
jgi:hypothetical protein